jgi:Flp pilus assembly protein TadD
VKAIGELNYTRGRQSAFRSRCFLARSGVAVRIVLLTSIAWPAACTSSVSFNVPSLGGKATANNDMPRVDDLDAQNTRRLFLILIDTLHKQGKTRAALAFLEAYNKQFSNDKDAMLLQAQCLTDTGAFQQAKPLFAALLTSPRAAAAYAGLGDIAASGHDWANAAIQFEKATYLDPSNAAYVNDLGFALIRIGQYDRGLAKLQQATQLDPANRIARNNLILGMTLAGRPSEAAQLVNTISDPNDRGNASQLLHVTTAANPPGSVPAAPIKE